MMMNRLERMAQCFPGRQDPELFIQLQQVVAHHFNGDLDVRVPLPLCVSLLHKAYTLETVELMRPRTRNTGTNRQHGI